MALPSEESIVNDKFSYTLRCGWVDWSHANQKGPDALVAQLNNETVSGRVTSRRPRPASDGKPYLYDVYLFGEEPNATPRSYLNDLNDRVTLLGKPAFIVNYSVGMEIPMTPYWIGSGNQWIVRKGLTRKERELVGLVIFLDASDGSEDVQSHFRTFYQEEDLHLDLHNANKDRPQLNTLYGPQPKLSVINALWSYLFAFAGKIGRSGYSFEDLVSNLIGYYMAFHNVDKETMKQVCGDVGRSESLKLWNERPRDRETSRSPRPLPHKGKHVSFLKPLEDLLNSLNGFRPGELFVKVKTPFVEEHLLRFHDTLDTYDFDSSGLRTLRRSKSPPANR